MRTTIGPHGDHLAVEDGGLERQPSDRLHDFGHPLGDVREAAGVGAHLVAEPVHLEPRAVELSTAGPVRPIASATVSAVCASIGFIGRSWSQARETATAVGEGCEATVGSSPASMSARRTSPAGTSAARAIASTMTPSRRAPKLAVQEVDQEALLELRGAREEPGQLGLAPGLRSGTVGGRDTSKSRVHVEQLECRRRLAGSGSSWRDAQPTPIRPSVPER